MTHEVHAKLPPHFVISHPNDSLFFRGLRAVLHGRKDFTYASNIELFMQHLCLQSDDRPCGYRFLLGLIACQTQGEGRVLIAISAATNPQTGAREYGYHFCNWREAAATTPQS